VDLAFESDQTKIQEYMTQNFPKKNTDSISKLLRLFFYYYGYQFHNLGESGCISRGKRVPKTPQDRAITFSILDPFDSSFNLGYPARAESASNKIIREAQRAYKNIQEGNIDAILEDELSLFI